MIATQFGLAMIPRCPAMAAAFTSGTTSGTSSRMRNAEELSTTTAPRPAATGANRRDVAPPAENSAMSMPSSAASVSSSTGDRLAAKPQPAPGRSAGGEQPQPRQRKRPLFQAQQQFGTDRAGGADDGNPWRDARGGRERREG